MTKAKRRRANHQHRWVFCRLDPLLYNRLIRRFQTAAEREEEGRKKGYGGVLEAELWRVEAEREVKMRDGEKGHDNDDDDNDDHNNTDESEELVVSEVQMQKLKGLDERPYKGEAPQQQGNGIAEAEEATYDVDDDVDAEPVPSDQDAGRRQWRELMEAQFLRGEDADFDYRSVDQSEEFDDHAWEDGRE